MYEYWNEKKRYLECKRFGSFIRSVTLLSQLIDINETRVTIDFDTILINIDFKYIINDNWIDGSVKKVLVVVAISIDFD